MDKLKKLEDILAFYDEATNKRPESVAYESDRLVQGMRYILNQPNELTEDIVKPTASEVKQMIDEAIADHYYGCHR